MMMAPWRHQVLPLGRHGGGRSVVEALAFAEGFHQHDGDGDGDGAEGAPCAMVRRIGVGSAPQRPSGRGG